VALFLLTLVPRVVGLDIFITPDEPRWMNRSASFLEAVLAGDFIHTIHSGYATPGGVTTKWCGSAGIVAKYLLFRLNPSAGTGASLHADNLGEFLRWLQSDLHSHLEQPPGGHGCCQVAHRFFCLVQCGGHLLASQEVVC
jgi:hypothetical protein